MKIYLDKKKRSKKVILILKKIKSIIKYDVPYNIVNYLLQYPLTNILSDYLIDNSIIQDDNELAEKCMNLDLYKVLEKYRYVVNFGGCDII